MKKQPISSTYDAEIELLALFRLFWAKKWFIVIVTLCCTLAGILLTHSMKPIYQAKYTFISPISSDLAQLNFGRTYVTKLKPITQFDAYTIFKGVVLSDSIKKSFLTKQQEEAKKQGKKLIISIDSTLETASRYGVIVRTNSREDAVIIAKKFMETLQNEARAKAAVAISQELKDYEIYYQQELALAHNAAKKTREDQIVRLKEALKIATALNHNDPAPVNLADANISNQSYLRGTRSLEAEIESLENRPVDEPYYPALRNLEFEHQNFMKIKPSVNNVLFARVDGDLVVSDKPENRKRKVLIILSALGGFLLACSFVFFRNINSLLKTESK